MTLAQSVHLIFCARWRLDASFSTHVASLCEHLCLQAGLIGVCVQGEPSTGLFPFVFGCFPQIIDQIEPSSGWVPVGVKP